MKTNDFSAHVGTCSLSLGLDRRKHRKDGYNLAMKYVINRQTLYYRLPWVVSEDEFMRITNTSTTRGRISKQRESDSNIRSAWQQAFEAYKQRLEELARHTPLSLETIRISLTGKSATTNFIEVWKEVIAQKGHGTAVSYETALKSFIKATHFSSANGFNVTKETIDKWVQAMAKEGKTKTTMGFYLRGCRVVIRECIRRGYIQQCDYPFSDREQGMVSIPKGKSRKEDCLDVGQMTELYNIFASEKYPDDWADDYKSGVHTSLGLFLFMYLGNGMNLADVGRLKYNAHYFKSGGTSLQFNRTKTKDRTDNLSEVIVPVIPQLRYIIDTIGAKAKRGGMVFPFILNGAQDEKEVASRIQGVNQSIRKRLKKLTTAMGWMVHPSATWCRHSFATNLAHGGVPVSYISEAMGHSVGKSVTLGYVGKYPHETQMAYNSKLLAIEAEDKKDGLESLVEGLSEEDRARLLEILKK